MKIKEELKSLFKTYQEISKQVKSSKGVEIRMDGRMHFKPINIQYSDLDENVKKEYDRISSKLEKCNFSCGYGQWNDIIGDLVFRIYYEETNTEFVISKPVIYEGDSLEGVFKLEVWKDNNLEKVDFYHEDRLIEVLSNQNKKKDD